MSDELRITPLERKERLVKAFKERKEQQGNKEPKSFSEFLAERGIEWDFKSTYLAEPYQPSEEEQNAINAVEEWLKVPEIFISAKQMQFIADKHNTTIKEMREALNYLRRNRHD